MNLLVYDTLFHSAVCGACLQACGTRGRLVKVKLPKLSILLEVDRLKDTLIGL